MGVLFYKGRTSGGVLLNKMIKLGVTSSYGQMHRLLAICAAMNPMKVLFPIFSYIGPIFSYIHLV